MKNNIERIPYIFSQAYLSVLNDYGYTVKNVANITGIDLNRLESHIDLSFSEYSLLLDTAIGLAKEKPLGVDVGKKLTLAAFGMLGWAILSSQTVSAAIQLCQRFWSLFGMGLSINQENQQDFAVYTLNTLPSIPIRHRELVLESAMTSVFLGLKSLTPIDSHCEIWFDYAVPNYYQYINAVIGITIKYNMPSCQWRLSKTLLNHKLPMFNNMILHNAIKHCELELRTRHNMRISQEVISQLQLSTSGYPSLEQVAVQLGITVRKLRRQLELEQCPFSELLNQQKKEDAKRLLHTTSLKIHDIAILLGYSNPANFTKAFKRWISMTPYQYRQSLLENGKQPIHTYIP